MASQLPLPAADAWGSIARCVVAAARLAMAGRVHLSPTHVGQWLHFGDGTTARIYRETLIDRPPPADPAVLVVAFRLRAVRGRGHDLFRRESLLNTPLFVGFPGLVSKLWLANDARGVYRGLYQWDGPKQAEHYARSLWRILALVSVPGSIRYHVLPGMVRDELLRDPGLACDDSTDGWWRPTAVPSAVP